MEAEICRKVNVDGTENIAKACKEIDAKTIHYIMTNEYPSKAIHPYNSRMSKTKLVKEGFRLLPEWKNTVGRYLSVINY